MIFLTNSENVRYILLYVYILLTDLHINRGKHYNIKEWDSPKIADSFSHQFQVATILFKAKSKVMLSPINL